MADWQPWALERCK